MSNSKYLAFLAAADSGSITVAAAKLGYTQSGVSHLIASLENELGVPLLTRTKNGVFLTSEGEQLLPSVRTMLKTEESILSLAASLRGLTTGHLHIGAFTSAAVHLLPELIRSFRRKYPGIELQISCGTYSTIEDKLQHNHLDCAFVTMPTKSVFEVHPLTHDRLMAVIPGNHPMASREEITVSQLAEFPFIVPAEGSNYHIGELFHRSGIQPNVCFEMDDDYAAAAMVSCGFGITILPEMILRGLPLTNAVAIPIQGASRLIGIAINRDRSVSPAVRAFLEEIYSNPLDNTNSQLKCSHGTF